MKPDSATAIPITTIDRVEQPAHEAQPGRALGAGPSRRRARAARPRNARSMQPSRRSNATRIEAPALIQASTSMPLSASLMAAHSKPVASSSTRSARCSPSSRRRRTCARRCSSAPAPTSARRARRPRSGPRSPTTARICTRGATPRRCTTCGCAAPRRWRCRSRPPVVLDALMASLRFHAYADSAPDAAGAAGARDPHRRSSPTGTGRCTNACRRPGWRSSSTARSPPPRSARPSPTARSSRAALELAGDAAGGRPGTWATRPRPTSRAPARPVSARPDRARGPAAGGRRPFARRAHTLGAALMTSPEPAASMPPEPRDGRSRLGAVRSRCSRSCSSSASSGSAVYGVVSASDPSIKSADDLPDGATLALTFFQDVVFVFGAWIAVKLSLGDAPRERFGLAASATLDDRAEWAARPTRSSGSPAIVLALIFGDARRPDARHRPQGGGLDAHAGRLGVLICVLAPVVEEFFFRGFMFAVFARRMRRGLGRAARRRGVRARSRTPPHRSS